MMSMMAMRITLYKRDRIDMGNHRQPTRSSSLLTIKNLLKGRVQLVFLTVIKKVIEMAFGNPIGDK